MAASKQVRGFDQLDRSFGRVLIVGYVTGFVVAFGLVTALLLLAGRDVSVAAAGFAALAVAGFAGGTLGAVIALGPWAAKHDHDINW
jgi:hypothetical protein